MKKTLEEDEKWSRATIRIMGKDLRPEEIESALGVKATRAHLRGEVRSLKHKAKPFGASRSGLSRVPSQARLVWLTI